MRKDVGEYERDLISDTEIGPVLQALPVSLSTELAFHTRWVIFENE